jgi:hypothetical protein
VKANRIPRSERLLNRIRKLEVRLDDCWTKEEGRFYAFCKYCERDLISVNMYGHHKGCCLRGTPNEILYYKHLLATCAGEAP